jgi:hypothetical protein
MTDRKITEGAFSRGPLRKIWNKQEHDAHLTAAGRERVEAALKAGVKAETKKFHLQYGAGDRHADSIEQFPMSKKYSATERRLLKPKEKEVIKGSLDIFFKRKPVEPAIKKEVEIKTPPRIEQRVSEPLPEAANDDIYKKAVNQ